MQNDNEELKSKIRILEVENAALSESVEDTMLFGLAAETIYQTEDSSCLVDQILERISILKNIPFCACLEQTSDGINLEGFYASFAELQKSEVQFSFPEISYQVPIDEGFLILDETEFQTFGFSFRIPGHSFHPVFALIIPCYSKSISNRFFVFLDENKTVNRFPKLLMLFQQIVQLASEKLENIFIFGEMTRLNRELDERVKERTEELIRTNRSLKREICERKIIERALNANEKKLRSVYNAAIDVSLISVDLTEEFIIRSFSPGAEKMFGYSSNEVIGKPLRLFRLPNQSYLLPAIRQDFDEIGWSRREEIILRRKSGKYFTAMLTVYPLFDEDSKPTEVLAVCIDISGLKQTQLELIKAKEKAEESDKLKTAFLQNMSHEIRTPMNAIIGFADLLPEYFDDMEKMIRFTNLIKQKGSDLLDIINEILDFSRIESGQLPLYPVVCKMSVFLDEIDMLFHEYQSRLNNNRIKFHLKVARDVKALEVVIDQIKLKQILINLVGNAFKFTSSGKIEVGCSVNEHRELAFYVSDTGIGIPKVKHSEIFSRFTQASHDTSRLYGGTGLGLSTVEGLLDLMGGKIWLESEKGQGSTFYFTIPYSLKGIPFHKSDKENKTGKPYNRQNVKILIVEDNEYNIEYLKEILTDGGFSFIHTCYGKKAIKICSQQEINLVLMDIRLPDISGYEATRQIRNMCPAIKIIVQTAYVTLEDREKAFQAGCDDFLSKPLKRQLLISLINSCLKHSNNQKGSEFIS